MPRVFADIKSTQLSIGPPTAVSVVDRVLDVVRFAGGHSCFRKKFFYLTSFEKRREWAEVANTRRAFTVEFKREAVRQVTQSRSTIATFSRDLGLHESVLRRWIQELSLDAETPVSEMPRDDEQSRNLSRLRNQVASRRIARETIATALGKFGTCSQADQVEAT